MTTQDFAAIYDNFTAADALKMAEAEFNKLKAPTSSTNQARRYAYFAAQSKVRVLKDSLDPEVIAYANSTIVYETPVEQYDKAVNAYNEAYSAINRTTYNNGITLGPSCGEAVVKSALERAEAFATEAAKNLLAFQTAIQKVADWADYANASKQHQMNIYKRADAKQTLKRAAELTEIYAVQATADAAAAPRLADEAAAKRARQLETLAKAREAAALKRATATTIKALTA